MGERRANLALQIRSKFSKATTARRMHVPTHVLDATQAHAAPPGKVSWLIEAAKAGRAAFDAGH